MSCYVPPMCDKSKKFNVPCVGRARRNFFFCVSECASPCGSATTVPADDHISWRTERGGLRDREGVRVAILLHPDRYQAVNDNAWNLDSCLDNNEKKRSACSRGHFFQDVATLEGVTIRELLGFSPPDGQQLKEKGGGGRKKVASHLFQPLVS